MDLRVEQLFAGNAVPIAVVRRVRDVTSGIQDVELRITKSQVAFRRHHGFAYVWRPGQYLSGQHAPAVLSIALGREDRSPRWKEVVHPSARTWMHHLEIHDIADIDPEVQGWILEAAQGAG